MERKFRKKILFSLIVAMVGVLAAGYPFFSFLWEDFHREDNVKQFEKMLKQETLQNQLEIFEKAKEYQEGLDSKGGSIVDPFEIEKGNVQNALKLDENKAFGFLVIPKLGVENNIYLGANADNLMKGVAQVEGTALPIGGKGTRSVIAGHRGTHRVSMMFRWLDTLEPGDLVYVYTPAGRLIYSMTDSQVILPSENEKLLPQPDRDELSLLTCHPFPVNNRRLVVNCDRRKDLEQPYYSMKEEVDKVEKEFPENATVQRSQRIHWIMAGLCSVLLLLLSVLFIKECFFYRRKS